MGPLWPAPAAAGARDPAFRDRGGIVIGWLTKVVVTVAVLGVLAFDGLSVLVAKVAVEGNAESAVMAASESYQRTPDVQLAYDSAVASLGETDGAIPPRSFTVSPDGTVTLRVNRTATTLTLRYFEPADSFTTVSATYTGRSEIA